MTIFLRFEHSSLPPSIFKLKVSRPKNIEQALLIFIKYSMICNWTCPKYWGNGPQRPKKLKKDHFSQISAILHASLDHKIKEKKLGKQLHVAFLSFHPVLKMYSFTCTKIWAKEPKLMKILKNDYSSQVLALLPANLDPKAKVKAIAHTMPLLHLPRNFGKRTLRAKNI